MATTSLPVSTPIVKVIGSPRSKFNDFSLDYSKILSDDYVHNKFLTLKYAGKGTRFNFAGKETLEFKEKDGKEVKAVGSEVKVVTNVNGINVETKFDSKGLVRVWTHWGRWNLGKPVDVSTKLKTDTNFSAPSGWVNVDYTTGRLSTSVRLHLKKDRTPYLAHKIQYIQGDFAGGYVAKNNLNNFGLRRYNLFGSYVHKDIGLHLEHVNTSLDAFSLGHVVFGVLYRFRGNPIVVKTTYRPEKKDHLFKVVAGTHYKVNKNTDLRVKVNSAGKLALSSKFKVHDNLSIVAATGLNLHTPGEYWNPKKTTRIPVGLSFEFSFV